MCVTRQKKEIRLLLRCVEFCMGVLGRAMAMFAHAFDPEVFVIGGGVFVIQEA